MVWPLMFFCSESIGGRFTTYRGNLPALESMLPRVMIGPSGRPSEHSCCGDPTPEQARSDNKVCGNAVERYGIALRQRHDEADAN